jgi:hypothetical protein
MSHHHISFQVTDVTAIWDKWFVRFFNDRQAKPFRLKV